MPTYSSPGRSDTPPFWQVPEHPVKNDLTAGLRNPARDAIDTAAGDLMEPLEAESEMFCFGSTFPRRRL